MAFHSIHVGNEPVRFSRPQQLSPCSRAGHVQLTAVDGTVSNTDNDGPLSRQSCYGDGDQTDRASTRTANSCSQIIQTASMASRRRCRTYHPSPNAPQTGPTSIQRRSVATRLRSFSTLLLLLVLPAAVFTKATATATSAPLSAPVNAAIALVLYPVLESSQSTHAAAVGPSDKDSTPNLSVASVHAAQGREIQQRVFENVDHFMNAPVLATKLTRYSYELNEFPYGMQPMDRDRVTSHHYIQAVSMKLKVYYGMETGAMVIINDDLTDASHRESGNSGYDLNDPKMAHYRDVCVDRETGAQQPCQMNEGDQYVVCNTDNCDDLFPCPTEDAGRNDGEDEGEATLAGPVVTPAVNCTDGDGICVQPQDPPQATQKWCRNYLFATVQPGEMLGFLPRSYACFDSLARYSQKPGTIMYKDEDNPDILRVDGTCIFADGTPVTRQITGPYAYCGNQMDSTDEFRAPFLADDPSLMESVSCENAFTGVYRTRDYDPRMRGWYITSKAKLRPFWTDPYVFFSSRNIGITWTEPLFRNEDGKSVFEGVLAVDYMLDQISSFLEDAYSDSSTFVAIYEDKAPFYMIGSSLSTVHSKKVQKDDPTKICDDPDSHDTCDVIRLSVNDLSGSEADDVIRNSHLRSMEAGFPTDDYVAVKATDDIDSNAYVAESVLYEHPKANLKWRIMVVTPVVRSDKDTITQGDQLFYPLILVASMGSGICIAFAVVLYKYRSTRAVIHADYRFTMAFIVFCGLINMAMFTMLGENTDSLCMTRFWAFFFLSSLAVSPLIVKIYRMYRLVGATASFQKVKITNTQAAAYTVPIPLLQAICLAIFSFVDPYHQREILVLDDGTAEQRIVCDFEGDMFWITECALAVSLLLVGCTLAYLTRNLDPRFGEAKQLIFSIYNLAFTGLVIVVILYLVGVTQEAERMLLTISVFWGTCLSSAAFVLPRILQARQAIRSSRDGRVGAPRFGNTATIGATYVSGLHNPSVAYATNNFAVSDRGTNDRSSNSMLQAGKSETGAGNGDNSRGIRRRSSTGSREAFSGPGGPAVHTDDRLSLLRELEKEDIFEHSSVSDQDVEHDQGPPSLASSNSDTSPSSSSQPPHATKKDCIDLVMTKKDSALSRVSEPESVHFDGDRCSWREQHNISDDADSCEGIDDNENGTHGCDGLDEAEEVV